MKFRRPMTLAVYRVNPATGAREVVKAKTEVETTKAAVPTSWAWPPCECPKHRG